MGKKKHRKEHAGEHRGTAMPLAGIATMVAAQVNSPAGRQAIAAGLRLAADALAGKPSRSAPPPRPAPMADAPPEPPRPETAPPPPPRAEVPPEVARVIGTVAAGLERWAAKMGTPRG